MGTSTSHPSPPSMPWKAVSAAYRNESQSAAQISKLLWRAWKHTGNYSIENLLGTEIAAACFEIAVRSQTPDEAVQLASREIARSRSAGIGAEIAKRAVAQCFSFENRLEGFAKCAAAEATNYLVSRDLSSLLGSSERLGTVSAIIELKSNIVDHVRATAGESPPVDTTQTSWNHYIQSLGGRLRGEH